jgi:hypothetical protein
MGMHPSPGPKPAWVDVVVPEPGMDADDVGRYELVIGLQQDGVAQKLISCVGGQFDAA